MEKFYGVEGLKEVMYYYEFTQYVHCMHGTIYTVFALYCFAVEKQYSQLLQHKFFKL